MQSQVAVADPVAAMLLLCVLSCTRYIMERAILKSKALLIKDWEENVPVSNGWPGRRVNLNSLGDKDWLKSFQHVNYCYNKRRWSRITSYNQPPD